MALRIQIKTHTGTEKCSLAGCGQRAVRAITATIMIPLFGTLLRGGSAMTLYLCADCDLELRQGLRQ
jgi:hypothetical protein